jgi:general secretion pathway protein F
MPQFRYRAVAGSGEVVDGQMEETSKAAVIARLQASGHLPIHAQEVGSLSWMTLPNGGLFAPRRPTARKTALMIQELAALLKAGLPVDRALRILSELVEKEAERKRLLALLKSVEAGTSLADSMAAQGNSFPEFCISMVRAGEASGSLEVVLDSVADFMEEMATLKEEVQSALTYPLVVLGTCCFSLAVLFVFVIPRFKTVFAQSTNPLPFLTQMVFSVSDVFELYWWALIAGPALVGALVWLHVKSPKNRDAWDARLLKSPLIGPLLRQTEAARFCRTLGTLLKNGVPLLGALSISRATLRYRPVIEAIDKVAESARAGKGLAEPLLRADVFPRAAVHMIRVGEETAKHDEMLLRAATLLEQQTRRRISGLLTMLGPAMTVVMGIVVLAVIGSILSAMLSVYDLTG